jgi:hypothetical protein
MKQLIEGHKTVAILPFKATIAYKKLPKGYSDGAKKVEELAMGSQMQSGLYTYLLRKSDDYTVQVQDVDKTNALLKSESLIN